MKDKVIEFNADKRQMRKSWEVFKRVVNECNPEDIKGCLFYLDPNAASLSSYVSAYGPDWAMTGRLRNFMMELEMEAYLQDFDGTEDEFELEEED